MAVDERKRSIANLALVWAISLILSISATGISVYTLAKERIDYSCVNNGHGFEPRYNNIPPAADQVIGLNLSLNSKKLEAVTKLTQQIYICDTCQYCGKTTK